MSTSVPFVAVLRSASILRRSRHVVERASIRPNVWCSAATRQLAAGAMIVFVAAVAKPSVVAVAGILCP